MTNQLTGKDYTEESLPFIRDDKWRNNITTSARIQPYFKEHNKKTDYFDSSGKNIRIIAEKNSAFYVGKPFLLYFTVTNC